MSSPNRRLALGAIAMFGLTVIQRGLGLVTVTILARLLDPRGLGAYNFTLNSSQAFNGLTRLGIDAGLHIELAGHSPAEGRARVEQALGEAFGLTLCLSSLAAVVMLGLAQPISDHLFAAPDLAPFMRIGVVVMLGQCFSQICYAGFAGLNAFAGYSRIAMAGGLIALPAVLAGALAAGAHGGAMAFAGSQLVTAALLFRRLGRECALRDMALRVCWPAGNAARLLKLGLPFYLGVLWLIPVDFYVLGLLSRTAGVELLGQLRAVQALMAVIAVLPNALSGPLVTYLTERHAAGHGEAALLLQVRVIWTSALLLSLALASIFPFAVALVFGPHFAPAGQVGVLAIAPFIGTMLLNVLQGALLAQRRSLALFWIGALMAGCQLAVAILLVPRFGLAGYFTAQAAAYGLGAAATGLWLFRTSGFRPQAGWLTLLLVATALTLGLLAFHAQAEPRWETRILASLGLLILLLVASWYGGFSRDERNRLALFARNARKRVKFRRSGH